MCINWFQSASTEQNASLLRLLAEMDYSEVVDCPDPQRAWNLFYTSALSLLESVYPTMTSADPPYLPPATKTMVRRKNRLMRSGRLEEASALARRIGIAIQKANNKHLRNIDPQAGPADLWRRVNQVINKRTTDGDSGVLTAASLNEQYARTSNDNAYSEPLKKHTVLKQQALVSEYRMFRLLDRLHHTADGLDDLPAWFLRLAAPAFVYPLAYLVNLSINSAIIPEQWKTAIIRPVAKVPHPVEPSDYRPISVVPVLSRMVERLVVQTYIYPAFEDDAMRSNLQDQYAFCPTGSTTAAIIAILQTVSDLLNTNDYVIIIALDFSKAFDTVRHSTLASKLAQLQVPDNIYNWLVEYLMERKHATRFAGQISVAAAINASVVQGSGAGPAEK